MNRIKILMMLMTLQGFVFASHTCTSTDCTENASVDFVQVDINGGLFACFDINVSNPDTCAMGPKCVTSPATDPGVKQLSSLLSTAKATGTKVDLYVDATQCIYPSTRSGWIKLTTVILDQ